MRGAGSRGIGALIAAAVAASCGWPEYAFDGSSDEGAEAGAAGESNPSGGSSGAGGTAAVRGGTSGRGGSAGSPDSCHNGMLDPPETAVDCGGGTCPACGPGDPCDLDVDCTSGCNTLNGICEPETCGDGDPNGMETDEDCGGPDCELRCADGFECRTDSDCESNLCQGGRCVASVCDPKAGPCGTATCHCANGRECRTHADCASGNCAGGTCAEGSKVFSRNDEPEAANVPTPAILQAFLVRNDGPSALPVGELFLRYFFTYNAVSEQRARCDESRAVEVTTCDGVMTPLFEVTPTVFVEGYVEVGLGGDGTIEPAGTLEIPVAIEATDGGLYTQNDDYSFSPNAEFAQNRNVTLYRRGVLIWGDEPAGVSITTTTTPR